MLDPANSMTTLTPMSETPSITSPHHQLHATSYHGMNHMMGHHHSGASYTPGMNHYGKKKLFAHIFSPNLTNFKKSAFEIIPSTFHLRKVVSNNFSVNKSLKSM